MFVEKMKMLNDFDAIKKNISEKLFESQKESQ